jgi:hypothetical protein
MKKLYILSLSLLALSSYNAQVVFTSDLSSWSGGLPTDFMGSKSNIPTANVVEITTGAEYGTSLAQLIETTSTHKRFTTQPQAVTASQGYEVKVWAKGQGEMRFGMFDDNSGTSAGYIAYTSYQTVSGTTSSLYSATITATNTTANGEFVISVRNTVAPDHIQIDSVSIEEVTVAPPTTVSVYDIQFSTATPADSPYEGQIVNTGGIVTYVRATNGFYISSGTGPWSGIYVYSTLSPSPVAVGDSITFTAEVEEFNGLTELKFPTNLVVVSQGNFFFATPVTTGTALTEPYEGCFVSACGVCTAADNSFGDWILNDGSGDAEVGDFFFTNTGTVGNSYNVKGIIDFAFGFFNWLPRNAGDVQQTTSCTSAINENEIHYNVYPNPTEDFIYITFTTSSDYAVTLTDISGKVIEQSRMNSTASIDLSNYSPGIYFLTVNNQTTKIIKK